MAAGSVRSGRKVDGVQQYVIVLAGWTQALLTRTRPRRANERASDVIFMASFSVSGGARA
jgi:hypothetical protein